MPPSSYRRLPVTSCGSCRNRFVPLPVLGTEFRFRLPRLQPPERFLDQRGSQLTNRSGEASKQSVLRREVVAAPLEAVPAASGAARLASALRAAENLGSRWEAANSRIGGNRHTESHSSRSMGSHSRATVVGPIAIPIVSIVASRLPQTRIGVIDAATEKQGGSNYQDTAHASDVAHLYLVL